MATPVTPRQLVILPKLDLGQGPPFPGQTTLQRTLDKRIIVLLCGLFAGIQNTVGAPPPIEEAFDGSRYLDFNVGNLWDDAEVVFGGGGVKHVSGDGKHGSRFRLYAA